MVDFEQHFEHKTNQLVIAFAGGPQNIYQFGRTLRNLKLSHVLMRDSTQHYHGKGVSGIGDRQAVIDYIRNLKGKFDWVITTGVSSGAYAALLYGQLTPVDEVIAVSPLSGRETDDFPPEYHNIIYDPNQADMDDLRKYFNHGPNPLVKAFISDDHPTCTCDRQMCTRIGLRDIKMIPGHTHGALAGVMRDKGMFKELFSMDRSLLNSSMGRSQG